ncbi:helix-turn-helix domain-containing protein [Methylococcus mesophilus]|uniref:helix-turn-helix domain-containing protein n=1 Tax=Methylococcus mesophilus TaxID=2993564 RepID=UPI00224B4283|nr:helix-turn-helix transcriptional regulator [Methylococcus mesophilus]UZR28124.1 helix-turn-helix transcriptional regulator [Methylococcus mesophilus]UZR30751.1 helix-turn-helix transcriptional regulator [Methylococcus mesophilus]
MPSPLGEKIRGLRKQKKLSLDQLADLTESSKSYLWELENKEAPNPSAEKIARIAAVLEVTTEFLMNDQEMTPDAAVADEAFFRKYKKMPEETKKKLRQLIDVWDDDP